MLLFVVACASSGPAGRDSARGADSFAPVDSADTGELVVDPDGPDPACTALGCVRALTELGAYTRADIEPYLYGDVTIDNGYRVYTVEYVTTVGTATETVTLPYDLAEPVDTFPLVVNAHGTIGVEDPCQLSGTASGVGLAALFGGRGAIGVAPDYPGLGTPGAHRYLWGETLAQAVLDGLRAAVHVAKHEGTPTDGRSAVVGLSEGGYAVLETAAWHSRYAPELDIRAFGASGPASVYEEQWRAGLEIDGPGMVYHALFAWSATEAAGEAQDALWARPDVPDPLPERCTWSPDFGDEALLGDDFPTRAEDVFSADFLAEYRTGAWDRFAWVGDEFDGARVRAWLDEGEQTAPIAIWQGTADTTVPAAYTQAMVEDLLDGGVDVDLHLVEGGEHTDTAFGFLAYPELATDESVAWVQAQLGG